MTASMTVTNQFFYWFLYGLNGAKPGIGGWVIFLLLALAAVIWVSYDNSTRRLRAVGWQMAVIFTAVLILPVIMYRFTTDPCIFNIQAGCVDPSPLSEYQEPIFYLGVLGGIIPVVLAIGYYVTFRGLTGCPRGLHPPFEAVLVNCPGCALLDNPQVPVMAQAPMGGRQVYDQQPVAAPLPPSKRKVQAWLVSDGGKSYQLCEHETTIGRLSSNDIYLTGDTTVSRQHAKIVEQNGRFKLIDLGSKGLTRVNGHTVREPVLLDPEDEIKFGDNTVLRFVGATR